MNIEETLGIDLGLTGDNNFQPWCKDCCISQNPQDAWTALRVATPVKCINYKDKSTLWVGRNRVDEIEDERVPLTLVSGVG